MVLCGAALILLTFPYLTQIADTAHGVLKETAAPLGPIFVRILRFIFGRARFGIETGGSPTTGSGADNFLPAASGGWQELLILIISWALIGILGLMAIGVCGYLMNYMVRWLLKRNLLYKAQPQSSNWLLKLFSLLKLLPRTVWIRLNMVFVFVSTFRFICPSAIFY